MNQTSAAEPVYLFCDANILLHYTFFTELDWCVVAGSRQVCVVITGATLTELEKKKFESADPRVRERAASVVKRVYEIHKTDSPIRQAVELRFDLSPLTLDWSAYGLDPVVADHRFLAHAIQFRAENQDSDTRIVTADIGLSLKCEEPRIGIPVMHLDDAYRLPERPDPDKQKIAELSAEIQRLRSQMPHLILGFGSERGIVSHTEVELSIASHPSEEETERELARLMDQYSWSPPPTVPESSPNLGSLEISLPELTAVFAFAGVTPEETQRYRKEMDQFPAKHKAYCAHLKKHQDFMARTLRLCIILENAGSAPAEDIDIFLYFPEELKARLVSRLLDPPDLPPAPVKPRSPQAMLAEQMSRAIELPSLGAEYWESLNSEPNQTGPKIRTAEVRYHIRRLKHHVRTNLRPLHVVFSSYGAVKPFGFHYSIVAEGAPQPFEGDLHVVVQLRGHES